MTIYAGVLYIKGMKILATQFPRYFGCQVRAVCDKSEKVDKNTSGVERFDILNSNKKSLEQQILSQIQASGNPCQVTAVHCFYASSTKQFCIVLDSKKPDMLDFYDWWSNALRNIKEVIRSYGEQEKFYNQLRSTGNGMFFGIKNSNTNEYFRSRGLRADEIINFK